MLLARDVAEYADVVKLDELPFDFERRRVSVVVQVAGRVPLLVTKGAPETILPLCTAYEDEEGVHPLDEPLRAQAAAQFRQLSAEGLRVLAVAWRHWEAERSIELPDESDLVFAGFLAFADPPLPEAAEAIRQLAADGVRIKLFRATTNWSQPPSAAPSVCPLNGSSSAANWSDSTHSRSSGWSRKSTRSLA